MAHVFHREFYEPEHDRRVLQQRAQILYESQDLFLEIYYDEEHDFPVVEYVENFTGNQNYNGQITGANLTGLVSGLFYGNAANPVAETGGRFAVQSISGPRYQASGIFAGKR